LAPSAVASSWPNILKSVGLDLSDLQDADVPKESVDDTDSKRGVPPEASKLIRHVFQTRLDDVGK
jgi:hypothetical protein